jgi:hypothetical protein
LKAQLLEMDVNAASLNNAARKRRKRKRTPAVAPDDEPAPVDELDVTNPTLGRAASQEVFEGDAAASHREGQYDDDIGEHLAAAGLLPSDTDVSPNPPAISASALPRNIVAVNANLPPPQVRPSVGPDGRPRPQLREANPSSSWDTTARAVHRMRKVPEKVDLDRLVEDDPEDLEEYALHSLLRVISPPLFILSFAKELLTFVFLGRGRCGDPTDEI